MNRRLIKPQTLRGFRDFLPDRMLAREHLTQTARAVYRSYGFSPIDTPALEYAEILLGKGGEETDKQLFRFTDQGQRDVALRFDLTVPFARFAAQHFSEIGVPFKRYHIGTVWRAEKPQKGRYREFLQCDFDTLGTDSNAADVETLLVIHDLMQAIGFERFTIRVNNRLVLNGLLELFGLAENATAVLRALDKLAKIGREGVAREMTEHAGATPEQTERILALSLADDEGGPARDNEAILAHLDNLVAESDTGRDGVARLRELVTACRTAGIPEDRLELDPSIARGLDYYTGTIYETFLDALPGIGSVCSGGRYDHLAELFTKERLPGVGASLGLDRLLAAMEEFGMVPAAHTPAPVLVTVFDAGRLGEYLRMGRLLRQNGIAAEVYPEARPLGKQLKYANRRGFRAALIAGADEFAAGEWQIKDLDSGEQVSAADAELVERVREILAKTGCSRGVNGGT